MTSQTELSVILPTYNEAANIARLIDRLLEVLADVKLEIVVVDDNSPDGTANLVADRYKADDRIKLIRRSGKPGLAIAIRDGIEASHGETIIVMDTDFNHAPEDAPVLFNVARHVDVVVGSRFIFGGGMSDTTRYYLSYFYNLFVRLAIGTRMDENLSGFFAIRRQALAKLNFDKIFWGYGDYFFRLLLLSQKAGLKHVQVPVYYQQRGGGESKTRFGGIFIRYTWEVVKLMHRRITGQL